MYQFERLFFLARSDERRSSRYVTDLLFAFLCAMLITVSIKILHVSAIRNISLLYLFVVLLLAINRGLYSAFCCSVIAFLAFDFFLVQPIYTFTVSDPSEWLALFFFLATAIVTGFIASMLQQSVQDANSREEEARALYQLVSATANESDLPTQLEIVAHTIEAVFAPSGIINCTILLPRNGSVIVYPASHSNTVSSEEEALRAEVLHTGEMRDFYDVSLVSNTTSLYASRVTVRTSEKLQLPRRFIRLIPLKAATQVIGLVRLVVNDDPKISVDRKLTINMNVSLAKNRYSALFEGLTRILTGVKRERSVLQASFFESFIDQTTAII